MSRKQNKKLLFVVNVDWFFISHRLPIALAAQQGGYEIHIATGLTDRLSDLVAMNFVVHPLQLSRGNTSVWSIFKLFVDIYKIIRSISPDVVHLVTIKPVLIGGLAARLAKVPAVVFAISGLGFVFVADGFKTKLTRTLVGMLYRSALAHKNLRVIFQNGDDQARVVNLAHVDEKKTTIISGSGVDLISYKVCPSTNDQSPIVMLASRLLHDKGIYEFVRAAKLIKSRNAKLQATRFVLVGGLDKENPASLSDTELQKIHDEAIVEVWGYRNDMPSVLSLAAIVVLPSYREGFPKVLIEAAGCGKPVVTTDVPGCRDAVLADVTGLLVPVKNSDALASAIERLLNDPELCLEMGRAGRLLAEKEFEVNSVVQKHLAIYQELLANIHS